MICVRCGGPLSGAEIEDHGNTCTDCMIRLLREDVVPASSLVQYEALAAADRFIANDNRRKAS